MCDSKNGFEKTKEFSFDTISNFDEHIDISIPNYSGLIEHILNISTYFIKDNSICYDFGCSTGKLIKLLKDKHKTNTNYIGIDKSDNMSNNNSFIVKADLSDFKPEKHCFSMFIFTLQFMDVSSRRNILRSVYDSLQSGGAVLISEKTFIDNGFIQDLYSFSYYDFKLKNFSEKEIISKQLDLRYIMRPLSENENIKMFKDCGFKTIETFWQSLQFKAWILIK